MRLVPAFERSARAVAFAETLHGRLALCALYAFGLRLHAVRWWWAAGAIAALVALLPKWRRPLLGFAAIGWALTFVPFDWEALDVLGEEPSRSFASPGSRAAVVGAALALALAVRAGLRALAGASAPLPILGRLAQRRPILCLVLFDVGLLAAARHLPLPSGWNAALFALALCFGRYLWFVAISLLDREGNVPRANGWRFGSWLPFWMGTATTITPLPKNGAALRKIEAKDEGELAVTMWKGVKLLAWSILLAVLLDLLRYALHGESGRFSGRLPLPVLLELPTREALFDRVAAGEDHSPLALWTVVLGAFFEDLLALAVMGHTIIAGARLCGYRALRNTWRPLQARSIADFWNRYFFYFKELLVDVFFYPTFLRSFRGRPRLRMFFATLAAAGFGNFLYHFLKEVELIAELGLFGALVSYRAYALYGLILGSAIGISQLRDRRARPRWFTPALVWLFYALVMVARPTRPLAEHGRFFAALIGIEP